MQEGHARHLERVVREDILTFINACFSCTGQRDFYGDAAGQAVSISFLHAYVLGNYRRLYARTLAAGINQYNQGQIILNLLACGRSLPPHLREEEGALIRAALRHMQPNRAYAVLAGLQRRRINNRRARAVARDYLRWRRDPNFDAVKYRSKLKRVVGHAHLAMDGELGRFLFRGWSERSFRTPLLETFRRAHYSQHAVYQLPYTVAEGLAARQGIPRERFLREVEGHMTRHEKLRLLRTSQAAGVTFDLDLARIPLTRLALYVLSLAPAQREERDEALDRALREAARTAIRRTPLSLERVAAVLDRSYSSSGSSERRRRPLAVALAARYLLEAAAREFRAFWTLPPERDLLVTPRGQTDLCTPLLDALDWAPDLILIVSDGFENDPVGATEMALGAFRRRLCRAGDPGPSVIHLNPVFDSDRFQPRPLGPSIPTVGLRDAEDIPTMLDFARYAEGTASLTELEKRLEERACFFLGLPTPVPDESEASDPSTPGTEEGDAR